MVWFKMVSTYKSLSLSPVFQYTWEAAAKQENVQVWKLG